MEDINQQLKLIEHATELIFAKLTISDNLCERLAEGQSSEKVRQDVLGMRREWRVEMICLIKYQIRNPTDDGIDWETMLQNYQNNNIYHYYCKYVIKLF